MQEQNFTRLVLVGNPNSGKTTLFNKLTGLNYKVANYPGVTVELKSGFIDFQDSESALHKFKLVDLPGIYSLTGISEDEVISTKKIFSLNKNDLILNVIDSTSIERSLYLTLELIDSGLNVVVLLNMLDEASRQGIEIYKELLSKNLSSVPVIGIIGKTGFGLDAVKNQAIKFKKSFSAKEFTPIKWVPSDLEEKLFELGHALNDSLTAPLHPTFIGLKYLSDPISLFKEIDHSEQIDSLSSEIKDLFRLQNIDCETFEATTRYQRVSKIVSSSCSFGEGEELGMADLIDTLSVDRFWGWVIFLLIVWGIFQAIFSWSQIPMSFIDAQFENLGQIISPFFETPLLKSLVLDGILAGVGGVLIFIPQIAILFFFISLLEESGYLSRAAFILDRIMRVVGLQGRSFIPLLSSFACAIPGILSTRTIPSKGDRIATIMIAPLMSCSARLPVYTLIISAFIPSDSLFGFISLQGLVLFLLYFFGVLIAGAVAFVFKKTLLKNEPAMFVMEIPPLRMPSLKNALRAVLDRTKSFVKSAGTMILACTIVLWALATFPQDRGDVNSLEHSYAGQIGKAIEPVIKPLGFDWKVGVSILASFAAREVFISSLATVYNIEDSSDTNLGLIKLLKEKRENGSFSLPKALSLLIFYVFACQCMSTLAVCKRETGSYFWTALMFFYMTGLAYVFSYLTYNASMLFVSG